ncbi:hypothetical protein TIFTF001_027420 [Ficus carica]|uniref:KIB1-4 beta-propeller domain-containing protein n=1 Tax=Ficus carica TaxID=3494 RepID=A0AA88DN13_FICCA|nr:hypothetical protein TIFTF001_027420 [Ficus carica]
MQKEKIKTRPLIQRLLPGNEVDKNNNKSVPWPNLPQRLIKHIQKNPILMQNINFGSVTKSWRSPNTRHCNPIQELPWLCVAKDAKHRSINDNDIREQSDHDQFCNMSFPRELYFYSWFYKRWQSRSPRKQFTGCSHGHLVARSATSMTKIYLIEPVENQWQEPPQFHDNIPFKCAAISSHRPHFASGKSWNLMVVTGISSPAFMFYTFRGESRGWIKQDCTITEPNYFSIRPNGKQFNSSDRLMQFTNVIGFEGKFYALSSQGTLAVVEEVGVRSGCFEIAALGKTRAVPSVPSKGFRESLIESNGEILLAFLISRKTLDVVDDLEVFRLCFDELSWIKMGNLGGRTLFLGSDCCVLVCASEVGCRTNCVYFTQRETDEWWEYDMEVGIISRAWRETNCTPKSFEWDEPISQVLAK